MISSVVQFYALISAYSHFRVPLSTLLPFPQVSRIKVSSAAVHRFPSIIWFCVWELDTIAESAGCQYG
jgi:hypothetical protein